MYENDKKEIVQAILDELKEYYSKIYILENNFMEFQEIAVSVSDETSLHNLNKREEYQASLRFMKTHESNYLDPMFYSVAYILDLVSLLDEIESSKDKYLIIKMIKEWIEEFEDKYNDLSGLIECRDIPNQQLDSLMVNIWTYLQEAYKLLINLY